MQKIILLLLLLTMLHASIACSLVFQNKKVIIVGRNMDWRGNMLTNLWILPRGILRTGVAQNNSLKWKSKYGSIITTDNDTIVTDGMNEKGLSAHILSLDESSYGKREKNRPGLSIKVWVQYYLDNFKTVDEAVKFTQQTKMQLVPIIHPVIKQPLNVHLAIEDATGDSAMIEYIKGFPHIYHGHQYTVLTNTPTLDLQYIHLLKFKNLKGKHSLPPSTDPKDRFIRASYYSNQSENKNINDLIKVMNKTIQPLDKAINKKVTPTIWQIFADLDQRIYYYKSRVTKQLIWVKLDEKNIQEGAPILKYEIGTHKNIHGNISKYFHPGKNI